MSSGSQRMRLLPGLALFACVAAAAYGFEKVQLATAGRAWLEALVIAILLGTAIRTAWNSRANSDGPALGPSTARIAFTRSSLSANG